jgi:hypothetical protein
MTISNIEQAKKWLDEELKSSGKVIVDEYIYIVSDIKIKRARKLSIMNDNDVTEYKCDLNLTLEDADKILFRYDSKNEELWCDYYNITTFFESKFGVNRMDIKELCKTMLEEHLNYKVVTTRFSFGNIFFGLEEHLNYKVVTTDGSYS